VHVITPDKKQQRGGEECMYEYSLSKYGYNDYSVEWWECKM